MLAIFRQNEWNRKIVEKTMSDLFKGKQTKTHKLKAFNGFYLNNPHFYLLKSWLWDRLTNWPAYIPYINKSFSFV